LALPDGEYLVELYFVEPWLGIGGGINAKGMRLFDVAINGKTVLDDLDIWNEVGTNTVLKKIVKAKITGGKMVISFPESKVGEALISAIAIASVNRNIRPQKPAALVGDLSCNNCKLQSWLDIGNHQYSDASVEFNSLPSNLYGADWIQFFQQKNNKQVSFNLTKAADIFVGIKKDKPVPEWLKEFENAKTEIITDENGGTTYWLYRKRYSVNTVISLPVNPNDLMMLLPVTSMQPAFDLKPVTSYRTDVAIPGKGVVKEKFAGRECAVIKTNEQTIIEWPVQTGVADVYAITMKYFYGKSERVHAKLQLIATGNNMMLDEPVSFTLTRDGKWNQFTINTGSMINAGNYTVRLIINNAESLAISGIEMQ
jgi:hypothetical protein